MKRGKERMKRIVALSLMILLCLQMTPTRVHAAQGEEDPIRVVVYKILLEFPDAQPYVDENNRAMVPARFIGEAMDAKVTWDEEKQQAKFVNYYGAELIFTIGSREYTFEGFKYTMDTEAIIKDGRTYVPVRYVAEGIGADVEWDADKRTVKISIPKGDTTITTGAETTYYSGISFNPATDVLADGVMTRAKSKEFEMKALESIHFVEEDGVYYIAGEWPELPEQFEWRFGFSLYYTTRNSADPYADHSYLKKWDIAPTGTFKKELVHQNISDLKYFSIKLSVYHGGMNSMDLYISTFVNGHYDEMGLTPLQTAMWLSGDYTDFTEEFDFSTVWPWFEE